jgi:LysR family transcriptional activator of mexEF-oprN operon
MNRNDLRRVDLNLLIVFETLMHERSVTRAAENCSSASRPSARRLSRLRSLFDDPLFVRTGRSMEPSARAVEIFALLSRPWIRFPPPSAAPPNSTRPPAPRCSASACPTTSNSPCCRTAQTPARRSPGIVLVVRRVNYILMPSLLASGEISIGVSYTTDLPANAKRKVLRRSLPKLLRADSVPGPSAWTTSAPAPMRWCRSPAIERVHR